MVKTKHKPGGRFAPIVVDRLSAGDVRSFVFSDNAEAQRWFAKVFSADIRSATQEFARAWNRYRALADAIALEKRPAEVLLFVHTALNSILTSFHLLVSGYPVPSGNLMRQFAECVAMALMCADKSLNVFDRYVANRRQFPIHKALDLVTQERISRSLQKKLHLDKQGYSEFIQVMKFYDTLSHASAMTLGHTFMFSQMGGLVLGSQAEETCPVQARDSHVRTLSSRYSSSCRSSRASSG